MLTNFTLRRSRWFIALLLSFGLALPLSVATSSVAEAAVHGAKHGKKAVKAKRKVKSSAVAQRAKVGKRHARAGKVYRSRHALRQGKASRRAYARRAAPVRSLAPAPEFAAAARRHRGPDDIQSALNVPLSVESRSALVTNAHTGEVLYGKNLDRTMPIASITKLMTAMVVLDADLDKDELVTISEADVDRLRHTHSRLSVGTVLTRGELLLLALMASENRAAAALARTYPGGTHAAIAAMNRKAQSLGMYSSRFYDSTGLNGNNVSTPSELVKMVQAANRYADIRHYSTQPEYQVNSRGHVLQYRNTNGLVKKSDWEINVSKTGFINEAGRCLVMMARVRDLPVVIVLMDSVGKMTRIGDAVRVKRWLEVAMR